ncbi:hypothetical protein SAMN04488511_11523 [Pedobacter suwonensis]|uniref:Uncharacterized protein n=1 Tax=Pedobacter suwonensis TaxID=332999 RepID=A0A1I0TV24_9SPHI|nr:hypothetical protein SAMN04488511_11523 [Pedobacter suwonensis]
MEWFSYRMLLTNKVYALNSPLQTAILLILLKAILDSFQLRGKY